MERFLDYFTPENYALELCFWRERDEFTGRVDITGELKSDRIKLHAVNLEISSVEWSPYYEDGLSGLTKCDFESIPDGIEIKITDEMKKRLADEGERDNFVELRLKFKSKLNTNMQGCYLSTYDFEGQKHKLITTQFESHYAREAFPCIDEPEAKATFDLTLILPDYTERDVVLANMPTTTQVNGKFEFARTPRMSTYLLAWVIGPLKSVSTVNQNGIKVSSYCALNQPESALIFANETAARVLEYYDVKFQEKYPLPKLDQVALPDFEAGAMENWGLVTYRESMMLADPKATLDTKKSVAVTVTHELAHQWFGNLVTMAWWDDLWLNESFATLMEYRATEALYPDYHIWDEFFTGDCLVALRRDCLPGVQAVQQAVHHPTEIATLFDGAIVYAKGARLMLMLMRLMGDEQFDQGIRAYFKQHSYSNAVGDDLWQALQPYADFDVKNFMHAWISQPGYPVVKHGTGQEWSQQRFLITGPVDEKSETWPLPKVSDDMSGHYLINLDQTDFQEKLAKFTNLSLEQQLRLLIDRTLLAKTDAVASSSLLDLLPKFRSETSAAVWAIVSSLIADLKLFCPPETTAMRHYQKYLSQLFAQRWQAIDLSAHELDSNALQLRDILLGLAYYAEDEAVLRSLADLYHSNVAQLPSELRSHILSAKLYFCEPEIFTDLLKQYQTLQDPEIKSDILAILGSFCKEPQHLKQLIALLKQPEIVRPQDHIFLYVYLLRNHRSRSTTLNWLIENWQYVKQLTGDKSIEDYIRYTAGAIREPNEATKFYDFIDQMTADPVLTRSISMAHNEVDARLRLIAQDAPGVAEKLANLINKEN